MNRKKPKIFFKNNVSIGMDIYYFGKYIFTT